MGVACILYVYVYSICMELFLTNGVIIYIMKYMPFSSSLSIF